LFGECGDEALKVPDRRAVDRPLLKYPNGACEGAVLRITSEVLRRRLSIPQVQRERL
jgi:hypothetical protein